MAEKGIGPYYYLSKVERASEAKLWNEIFTWTEAKLGLDYGTIKASALIENILACFEAEDILYELRDHSYGLNCGIWDYAASIIAKFGNETTCIQNKENWILSNYMIMIIFLSIRPPIWLYSSREKQICQHGKTLYEKLLTSYCTNMPQAWCSCHQRNGSFDYCTQRYWQVGSLMPNSIFMQWDAINRSNHDYNCNKFFAWNRRNEITRRVCDSKKREIEAGVDGFLVYDINLVRALSTLWQGRPPNQIDSVPKKYISVTTNDLLQVSFENISFFWRLSKFLTCICLLCSCQKEK